MKRQVLPVVISVCMVCSSVGQAVTVDWVTVGDAGNVADSTGYGAVDYEYRIGQYEVTNAQYCEFLNAAAASDPHGLYHGPAIIRSGDDGSYTYSVSPGFDDKPVVRVSLADAMRFTNWLNNGQGAGSTEYGAYNMSLGDDVFRSPEAQIFLPSEDEWYKAAYYKGDGTNAGYWSYPTQSNTVPIAELPPGGSNSAHYSNSGFGPVKVGSYPWSRSAYGTFDQAGNVWEKLDTRAGDNWIARGGSFATSGYALISSYRDTNATLTGQSAHSGFRLASIPEPTGLLLLGLGSLTLLRKRHK